MEIEGSVALVTGANRGIGKAIADELLARGAATVYGGARTPSSITTPGVTAVRLDITDPDQVADAAGRLDDVALVVNNAGIATLSTPLSASIDDARAELETNYLGLVRMTEAFAPVLQANGGGAFVNVLSVVSWVAMPHLTTYSASKAAAWSYSNAARVELAGQRTEVVGVHVGYVDTDLSDGLDGDKVAPQLVATAALDALVAGKPEALVDELARTIKAGLSDDHTHIYPGIRDRFLAGRAQSGRTAA